MGTREFIILTIFFTLCNTQSIIINDEDTTLSVTKEGDILQLRLEKNGIQKLTADLGVSVNLNNITSCPGIDHCLQFVDDSSPENVRLHITNNLNQTFQLLWLTSNLNATLQDCYDLNRTSVNWFGGPERFHQKWPIEKLVLDDFPYVTSDGAEWGAIAERYWLNSQGAYIFIDDRTPLFVDQNSMRNGSVCFAAKTDKPYLGRTKIMLNYTISAAGNVRDAHLHAVRTFLGIPNSTPNRKIVERPIWSTWARYQRPINDSIVLEYAKEILENGYVDGQLEIDDFWETCYGSLTFRSPEFDNITGTVSALKQLGFRVTLWTHPFVNTHCTEYTDIGLANGFFVKNEKGNVHTNWWNSGILSAQYIDFTNSEAREWFVSRLRKLQVDHGIDSFKFDAGETTWAPQAPVLSGDVELAPNSLTQRFVEVCAQFGDLLEVRVGFRSQHFGLLTRMIDKDSVWGENNGLYTLITTLLQMNVNGYTMVLPDMIGGNGYQGSPSPELFVRWMQANTFMPSVQFSFVPWDFPNDTLGIDVQNISKAFVDLHYTFSGEIIRAMEESVSLGHPVNAPIWWIDPTNPDAMAIDTQYLLGQNIVVAPVVEEQADTRSVFLPTGTWVDGNNGTIYEGPVTLENYYAPIDLLPYFVRQGSEAEKLL